MALVWTVVTRRPSGARDTMTHVGGRRQTALHSFLEMDPVLTFKKIYYFLHLFSSSISLLILLFHRVGYAKAPLPSLLPPPLLPPSYWLRPISTELLRPPKDGAVPQPSSLPPAGSIKAAPGCSDAQQMALSPTLPPSFPLAASNHSTGFLRRPIDGVVPPLTSLPLAASKQHRVPPATNRWRCPPPPLTLSD